MAALFIQPGDAANFEEVRERTGYRREVQVDN
jgi:hypothetical protein